MSLYLPNLLQNKLINSPTFVLDYTSPSKLARRTPPASFTSLPPLLVSSPAMDNKPSYTSLSKAASTGQVSPDESPILSNLTPVTEDHDPFASKYHNYHVSRPIPIWWRFSMI